MNLETPQYNMVHKQLCPQQVSKLSILSHMADLQRAAFVPKKFKNVAYSDMFIPLANGQVMLPPCMIGQILQALDLRAQHDSVLEVGTGSGYLTALLSKLAKKILSIEIFSEISECAAKTLKSLDIHNVRFMVGDGLQGCPQLAPFDVIVLSGSVPCLPKVLRDQLAIGGRIFSIIGTGHTMSAVLLRRLAKETWSKQILFQSRVPRLLHAPEI